MSTEPQGGYTVVPEPLSDGRRGHAVYSPDGHRIGFPFPDFGTAQKIASDLNEIARRAAAKQETERRS